MAEIIGVSEGTAEQSKTVQKDGLAWKVSRTFKREYKVLASIYSESITNILAQVPTHLGFYVPSTSNMLMVTATTGTGPNVYMCKTVTVKDVETVIHPVSHEITSLYHVVCEFDNDIKLDPLDMEPSVRVTCENVEKTLDRDVITGKGVQTVPGEILPAVTSDTVIVLEITRYENFPFNMSTILEYKNTVCSDSFWGATAKHALMDDISYDVVKMETSSETYERYTQVKYRIKFRFDDSMNEPWKLKVLHYGNLRFEKQGEAPIRNVDDYNKPCPCNLDAQGFKLAENAEPVFLEFNRYKTKSWSSLNIDFNDIYPDE